MRNNCTSPHRCVRQFGRFALWKFTFILLLLTAQAKANDGYAQNTVTLTEKNVPINKVLKKIQRQTGYTYFAPVSLLQKARNITIDVKDVSLTYALDKIFETQPLTYKIVQKVIIVQEKGEGVNVTATGGGGPVEEVRGRVTDPDGEPIAGANVAVKGTNKVVVTDKDGNFVIADVSEGSQLEISFVGYEKRTVIVRNGTPINTSLAISTKELDVAIVQAYGTTTQRLNTGNIVKVSANEISRQPVTNPLLALHGRVPGLEVVQSNGIPGSAVKVEIRGQGSLIQGTDPLFIIDGVPFSAGNGIVNQITSAANNPRKISEGGLSPFAFINPADIESIEVLKDADATSIYGSRGANGVILITTKKGKAGKTKINANLNTGISRVTRTMDMLNTAQYIEMRREAFNNDGVVPNSNANTLGFAPDITIWDTTAYTDFRELLIGGTAQSYNGQISVSGGNKYIQFLIGGGFNRETTVFPGDMSSRRASAHMNVKYLSADGKVDLSALLNYSDGKNNLVRSDLTTFINLPPNFPALYSPTGSLNWTFFDNQWVNPMADLLKKYSSQSDNLISNIQLGYRPFQGMSLKANLGYNVINVHENLINPKAAIAPQATTLASSTFGNSQLKSWIIEPQAEYVTKFGKSKITLLLGSTFQQLTNIGSTITGTNYRNDLLLGSLAGAGTITADNSFSDYRYMAGFGRVNYNYDNRYIVNLTARRDGSSRFGPENRFNNFAAVGAGWIFSNEDFIRTNLRFLSYGKLRASYGSSGNDQIGNYMYLDTWSTTSQTYQSTPGLLPTRLYNPVYAWETSKKFEGGLELGFLNDRILFTLAYFRNRSGNQLVLYNLPSQTGFGTILRNMPAVIENSGWEVTLMSKNLTTKDFQWSTSFNLSVPRNKLVSFPGIETSSYATVYSVGSPLRVINAYNFLGVDPATGIYKFQDLDTSGTINSRDRVTSGFVGPKLFGGFGNDFKFRNFELNVFFEFKNQLGRNYYSTLGASFPGRSYNQPTIVLDRWRKPGDVTPIQRYVAVPGNPAFPAASATLPASNAIFSDASYVRLRNASVYYNFKWGNTAGRVYLQGQNLLTITNYVGSDPETQNIFRLPPLKTYVVGVQLTL